jgi:hypothetical protein
MTKSDYLIECIVRDVISNIVSEQGKAIADAMAQFYNSAVFEKLQDIETGLYFCSSAYVYDLYLDEMQYGKIIQKEI